MRTVYLLFVVSLFYAAPALAQDAFFEFNSLEEGMEAAKDRDKLVIVYYFDEAASNADAYNHLWSDPLVARFVDKLAVPVVISSESEAGQKFKILRRGRRSSDLREPGIYFLSTTGRSLGVLKGALEGQEGIGQMMLMLGAADYARHENKSGGRRRHMRYR